MVLCWAPPHEAMLPSCRAGEEEPFPQKILRHLEWHELQEPLNGEQKMGLSAVGLTLENGTIVAESRCTLTVMEFIGTALQLCNKRHDVGCEKCSMLVRACMKVTESKVIPLSNLWSTVSVLSCKLLLVWLPMVTRPQV